MEKRSSGSKVSAIASTVIIIAFFLPWVRACGVEMNGYDIATNSNGRVEDHWIYWLTLLVPIACLLLFAFVKGNTAASRAGAAFARLVIGIIGFYPLLNIWYNADQRGGRIEILFGGWIAAAGYAGIAISVILELFTLTGKVNGVPSNSDMKDRWRKIAKIVGIVIAIAILIYLIYLFINTIFHLVPIPNQYLWPFVLIVPGILLFRSAVSSDKSSEEGLSLIAGILISLGLVLLFQALTGFWPSWAYAWALIVPTSIGLSQIMYGNLKKREDVSLGGRKLTKLGLTIFTAGLIFFEFILGINGFGFRHFGIQEFVVVLILIAAFFLVRYFMKKRKTS